MDYTQLKAKLEKIIEFENKYRASSPPFGSPEVQEYNKLLEELKKLGYDDLKNYHSHAVLEMELMEKRHEKEICQYEYAGKLAKNKIEAIRKTINSDREIRITEDE